MWINVLELLRKCFMEYCLNTSFSKCVDERKETFNKSKTGVFFSAPVREGLV
jgi:hypothetical protein